ncbi:MAG: alpha/beta hydrolase [bacterium]
MTNETTFLILHGYQGSGTKHWQTWLASELEKAGKQVLYPALPSKDQPSKNAWLQKLTETIKDIDSESLVVLAHSIGCSLWLHYANKNITKVPKMVYLVSPTTPDDRGIEEISSFFPLPKINLFPQREHYLMVASDNDPYMDIKEFKNLELSLSIPFLFIPDAGHINVDAGYGEWPWILEECLKH